MADKKDNTIDLFSKRKLSDIEEEAEEQKKLAEEDFKEAIQFILDLYQDGLDEGDLEGIAIVGVVEDGIIPPKFAFRDTGSLHKLQFAVNESQSALHEYIAEAYNLRDMGYIDED